MPNRTVYISDQQAERWDLLQKAAAEKGTGCGEYILQLFEKVNYVPVNVRLQALEKRVKELEQAQQ